jgi:DNA-binding transcriptional MerR regulator
MPVEINGRIYYRTAEVYRMIGISRNTLYAWLKKGVCKLTDRRDTNGWRLFTLDDIDKIKQSIYRIVEVNTK